MKRHLFADLMCCLFTALFVYAALTKLMDFEKFQVEIGQSPMLAPLAGIVSIGIPLTELLVVVLIIIPRTRLIGMYGSLILMVMFTAYIMIVSRFSEHVPCSCGGILSDLNWNEHLLFNSVFTILAVVLIFLHKDENIVIVRKEKTEYGKHS